MAIVVYMSVVHCISYKRIVQTLSTLYKINISEGSVDNLIKKASKPSKPELEKIVSELSLTDVVGIDEAGVGVAGSRDWNWVFQNDRCTYKVYNESRGTKVIDEHFEDGFINTIVVHDNYSSYNNLISNGEQLCFILRFVRRTDTRAHKLRDINYAIECDDSQVMKDMKLLLKEAVIDHKLDLLQSQRDMNEFEVIRDVISGESVF